MRRGSVAIILTIIVMSFMMAISASYVTMVQTETKIQKAQDKTARAKDAAFAGVSYAIARLLATSSTFLGNDSTSAVKGRLYFAHSQSTDDITKRMPSAGFYNVASSQWLFPNTQGLLLADELASSVAFIITSYPATTTTAGVFDHNRYYVKSIGMYRELEPSGVVIATYTAQILARLTIATSTKTVALERYQYMEVENGFPATASSSFFGKRNVIYP